MRKRQVAAATPTDLSVPLDAEAAAAAAVAAEEEEDRPTHLLLHDDGRCKKWRRLHARDKVLLFLFIVASAANLCLYVARHGSTWGALRKRGGSSSSSLANDDGPAPAGVLARYEGCITFPATTRTNATFEDKPFWFPMYPDSFDDATVKSLISGLAGMDAPAKSYYATNKALKKCKGPTPTAVCMLVHPIIKTTPEKFAGSFQQKVIYAIRNPATALPRHHNGKAIKYHGHPPGTQVSREEWRKFRDEFMEKTMQDWLGQIRDWKGMVGTYDIGMYVRYEDLMDVRRGPRVAKALVKHLRQAGFPTVNDDDEDVGCVWYKAMGRDALERYAKHGYEYGDYKPGYTRDQREYLLREMNALREENGDDADLVAVLDDYIEFIRDKLVIDNDETSSGAKQA